MLKDNESLGKTPYLCGSIRNRPNEEVHFKLDDAADGGDSANAGGMPASGRAELSADKAVQTDRADDGTDGGEHSEGVAAADLSIGTGNLSE